MQAEGEEEKRMRCPNCGALLRPLKDREGYLCDEKEVMLHGQRYFKKEWLVKKGYAQNAEKDIR